MRRKSKKEVERIDGLLLPGLMQHIGGISKEIIENMVAANKSMESARLSNARSNLTILDTVLSMIGKPDLPVVKMTQAIISQIPNANKN